MANGFSGNMSQRQYNYSKFPVALLLANHWLNVQRGKHASTLTKDTFSMRALQYLNGFSTDLSRRVFFGRKTKEPRQAREFVLESIGKLVDAITERADHFEGPAQKIRRPAKKFA
jgi:hypothetical protein